jgi:hypothetical protein
VLEALRSSADPPMRLTPYMQIKAKVASHRVRKLRGLF